MNTSVVDELALARVLAEEAQVGFVEKIDPAEIVTSVATRVPINFAKAHRMLVVREDEHAVHVVCGDPFDTQALDDLRVIFDKPVEAVVGGRDRIEDAINRVYEKQAGEERLESDDSNRDEEAASDILDSDDEAPVIRWVNSLFLQAMKERASDIHIEPEEKEVIVRYRIDGELYIARRAARAFMNSIISRIKIESALNIAAEAAHARTGASRSASPARASTFESAPSRRAAATSGSSCVCSTNRAFCSICPISGSARGSTR